MTLRRGAPRSKKRNAVPPEHIRRRNDSLVALFELPEGRLSRRLPIRAAEIALDAPYRGWRATVRLNVPMAVLLRIERAKPTAATFAALARCGIASNFVDDDGRPVNISVAAEWSKLPVDLMRQFVGKFRAAVDGPIASPAGASARRAPNPTVLGLLRPVSHRAARGR